MHAVVYDAAGHRRSPVTTPGFHEGRAPKNKGQRCPADPPTVEEIVAVMRAAGEGADGARLRALIVILWRAGLRIGEVLDLAETDLDASRGAVLVRRGKGGRRREVGMDRWAWSQFEPWVSVRRQLPVGALLCVIRGATAGRHWESSSARKQLARTAVKAGVRRRFAPHQYADILVLPTWWSEGNQRGGGDGNGWHNAIVGGHCRRRRDGVLKRICPLEAVLHGADGPLERDRPAVGPRSTALVMPTLRHARPPFTRRVQAGRHNANIGIMMLVPTSA